MCRDMDMVTVTDMGTDTATDMADTADVMATVTQTGAERREKQKKRPRKINIEK